jgi:hypothetical protein
LRLDELAEPQRRLHDANARLDGNTLGLGADRLAEGLERFAIPRFFEEEGAELELEIRVFDVVAPLHTRDERRDHGRRNQRQARTKSHRPSSLKSHNVRARPWGRNPRPGGDAPLPHEPDSTGTAATRGNVYFWKCLALISM